MPAIVTATCGFVAGVIAGLLFSPAWLLAPFGSLFALASWRRSRRVAACCAALAAGSVWGAAALGRRAGDCRLRWRDGARVTVVAEPRDLSPGGETGRRLFVRSPAACAGPIQVVLAPADTASGVLTITGTWRSDPTFKDHLLPQRPERAGRLVALRAKPMAVSPGPRGRLRLGAERRLAALFGPARWPLAAALTVSPEASLPLQLRQDFRRSGLTHILSISGFHVAILAGALIVILRAARLSPDAARIAGTVLVIGYVWLLGFPAPALRSAGLIALWCWARVRQRPPLPAGLLAATALAVTIADPWAVLEPGPWLSFGGVWGCAAAARWWERLERESRDRLRRRLIRLSAPVAVSVGATLATSPVQVLSFGTITPIGIVANLAAIPLAAFAVPALALALLLASLPFAAAAHLAAIPAAASGLALDGLERAASLAARASWATFDVAPPIPVALAAAMAAWWLLRAGPRRRGAGSVLGARCSVLGAAVLAVSCWLPLAQSAGASDGPGSLALHFLAVGQGDAMAIRTPHGHWMLIDAGPRIEGRDAGARKVVPFLRLHGARRLDLVVASHAHADHVGGLPAVLAAFPADLVLEPGISDGGPLYLDWLTAVGRARARWHPARAGEQYQLDGVALKVWSPDSTAIQQGWDANESSVVLSVEYGAFRAVFSGDAGLPMEARHAAAIGDVTLLKVGHHGSHSASGEEWLADLRPELCIIEVGARNNYGHPDPGVVARLEHSGCRVWRTDLAGDVTVQTDGRTVRVSTSSSDTTLSVQREMP